MCLWTRIFHINGVHYNNNIIYAIPNEMFVNISTISFFYSKNTKLINSTARIIIAFSSISVVDMAHCF